MRGVCVCVCVCVFSLVTPRSRDCAIERQRFDCIYCTYIGFVIHGKGQIISQGGFLWSGRGLTLVSSATLSPSITLVSLLRPACWLLCDKFQALQIPGKLPVIRRIDPCTKG